MAALQLEIFLRVFSSRRAKIATVIFVSVLALASAYVVYFDYVWSHPDQPLSVESVVLKGTTFAAFFSATKCGIMVNHTTLYYTLPLAPNQLLVSKVSFSPNFLNNGDTVSFDFYLPQVYHTINATVFVWVYEAPHLSSCPSYSGHLPAVFVYKFGVVNS